MCSAQMGFPRCLLTNVLLLDVFCSNGLSQMPTYKCVDFRCVLLKWVSPDAYLQMCSSVVFPV